jgi:uncharacterized lipoprotein YddW (UPF0748 family)
MVRSISQDVSGASRASANSLVGFGGYVLHLIASALPVRLLSSCTRVMLTLALSATVFVESSTTAQAASNQVRLDSTSVGAQRALGGGIKHFGSEIIQTQRSGNSLRLRPGAYAEVGVGAQLQAAGGTISFWVYPLWQEDDHMSHTFVSLAWNDPKKSYLAITFGWWEPQGRNRLYFIVSNQEFIHCSLPYEFERAAWTMVTAVWKSGANGYCKLFINGGRVAIQDRSFVGNYAGLNPLYLGSDKGTTQVSGRSADALLDELLLYPRPFSEKEARRAYEEQEKDQEGATARKWRWLDEGLAIQRPLVRSTEGGVLESRVMFDEDMHWAVSRENADNILSRVKAAGLNVYVPCVWHGNGAYYPTSVAELDPKLAAIVSAHDPLAYLIQKAHSLGIEVHPWFTVMRRENALRPSFFGDGVPDGAYDVHNPEFRKFIVDLMLDLVRRYDVDGVNLDYIRAMGICTSDSCQDDYRRLTGERFWADYYLRGIGGPARNRLEQWQDRAVREIVATFSTRAREIKPNLLISVDGHPKPHTEVRPLEGRNEVAWLNEGLVDVVFAMDYRETIDYRTIDAVRKDLLRPEQLMVLFGNYDRLDKTAPAVPRTGVLVAKYASYAQRRWSSLGVGFYIYAQMSDDQVFALRNGPFKETAVPSWTLLKRRRNAAASVRTPQGLGIR